MKLPIVVVKHYRSPIAYRLREISVDQIKVWKDAQARKLDLEGIAELARSIKNEGLQNPPMVQKESKNSYLLMSGQRRFAALKKLGAKKIPVLVLTQNTKYDLEDAKAASVIENLHRNKMNTKDMTEACVFLAKSMGKSKAAKSLGISSQTLKKYLGFAAVPDRLKEYVPKKLSRDDVIKIYQITPDISKSIQIAEKVIHLDQRVRKQYLLTMSRSPKSTHLKLLKKAKAKVLQQKIILELNKNDSRKLRSIATRNDLSVAEMTKKIISRYIKKR